MIDNIRGTILRKTATSAVVEVGGIGFSLLIPLSVYEKLGPVGSPAALVTYLHVREDILQLYGFADYEDRDLFIRMIGISGVGPKMALAILSRFGRAELSEVVAAADNRRLSTVKGIGPKTAERLIVEFRNRLPRGGDVATARTGASSVAGEAVRALEALGYNLTDADDAVRKSQKLLGDDAGVEALVRTALKG